MILIKGGSILQQVTLQDGTQWVPTVGGYFLHKSLEFTVPAGKLEVIVETDDGTSIKKQRRIAFAKK